ncbi:hypothetical protein Tco_0100006 [Tanacetum coccineum]
MNTHKDGFDTVHGKTGADVVISLAAVEEGCTTYARALIEVSSKKDVVDSLVVAIPFQNGSGHFMNVKVAAPTQESDDGFMEVTRKHGKGKQNGKPRHIDGVRLTKPQPNYFYRLVSKPVNVNDEASTSRPKGNKEASSLLKSNVNDTGNPMDDLVDETWKKVEVILKKTPEKTGI